MPTLAKFLLLHNVPNDAASQLGRSQNRFSLNVRTIAQTRDQARIHRVLNGEEAYTMPVADWTAVKESLTAGCGELYNRSSFALLEHTPPDQDPDILFTALASILAQYALGLWAGITGGRRLEQSTPLGSPDEIVRNALLRSIEPFRQQYTTEFFRRHSETETWPAENASKPNDESGCLSLSPGASTDDEELVRGELRSRWLDARYAEKGWTSDSDPKQPTYNTIKRYRSGKKSNQDRGVRLTLSKALAVLSAKYPNSRNFVKFPQIFSKTFK